ncbi:Ubiquitin-like superfamily protein [Abeliophyllum distichum]|uniref:Ubiquitin-like superfamily protein n=1 Tax=Abeliophyllum distichum TaxID=126358 RepID=A0ABD1Q6K9_9LAMI
MKVVAEIMTGKLFYIQVEDNATVADLKREIGIQEDLPGDRLILMLDNNPRRLMDKNDVSLTEYGVRDGSRIYLFFDPLDDDFGNIFSNQDPILNQASSPESAK